MDFVQEQAASQPLRPGYGRMLGFQGLHWFRPCGVPRSQKDCFHSSPRRIPMTIRKFIGIILSFALIIGGFWIAFAQIEASRLMTGKLVWVGPMLILAGGFWIYSDWFE